MENLKNVLKLPLHLGMAYDKAKQDGKIDLSDAQYLVAPVMSLFPAISSAQAGLEEWKNLSKEQKDEVCAWVEAEFDIAHDESEAKIEQALCVVMEIGRLVGVLSK